MRAIDLTGQQFGRWTVIQRASSKPGSEAKWLCRCECGAMRTIVGSQLRNGRSKSCGCLAAELTATRRTTHGKTNTRLYPIWNAMQNRCYNPNHKEYHRYGGRGIAVCTAWRENFLNFHEWAMANGYDENAPYGQCTLDRIDNDKGYSPDNCRWVTMQEQQRNKGSRGYGG